MDAAAEGDGLRPLINYVDVRVRALKYMSCAKKDRATRGKSIDEMTGKRQQ
jgi:hypothetical protein